VNADFATLTDEQLAFALELLELRLDCLRYATTAIGQALCQELREKFDAAKGEHDRRRV
jgi:hypothetical protein